jgi:menaquinone-dependent protoporphyrinogen oxidase
MKEKILVTYASKHGSTAEIAERIARSIEKEGNDVNICPVDKAGDPLNYSTIIIGTAVYIGKWRKAAVDYLKRNQIELANTKVWMFATGPTGEGDPDDLLNGWKYPDSLKPVIENINPFDIKIFHGALDDSKLDIMEKLAIKMVKAPLGDFRDWDEVEKWAVNISNSL